MGCTKCKSQGPAPSLEVDGLEPPKILKIPIRNAIHRREVVLQSSILERRQLVLKVSRAHTQAQEDILLTSFFSASSTDGAAPIGGPGVKAETEGRGVYTARIRTSSPKFSVGGKDLAHLDRRGGHGSRGRGGGLLLGLEGEHLVEHARDALHGPAPRLVAAPFEPAGCEREGRAREPERLVPLAQPQDVVFEEIEGLVGERQE